MTAPVRISRRALLAGASALAAGPLRARSAPARESADVIVVGAGLSGLHAASLLEELGARVVVLEGRERVGGRVLTLEGQPGDPEAGANEALGGYGRHREVCRRLGVELVDLAAGQRLNKPEIALSGRVIRRAQWAVDAENVLPQADRASHPGSLIWEVVGRHNPLKSGDDWSNAANTRYDSSVHEWLAQKGYTEDAIRLVHDINPYFGRSARETSALMWFASQRWFELQHRHGVKALVAKGGNSRIPKAMAQSLKGDVVLGAPVVGVRQEADRVTATCEDGRRWTARFAVCAMPLGPMRWVRFDPLLPPVWLEAIQLVPQMWITQVHLLATEEFWEADGLDPGIWTDGPAGVVTPYRNGSTPGEITSLMAWGRGFTAQYLDTLGAEGAGRAVVEALEALRPAARGKLRVIGFKSWQLDRFAGGDWAVWAPGQATRLQQRMVLPHGRVHFCGEHLALADRGMEGALESGERVAVAIAQQL